MSTREQFGKTQWFCQNYERCFGLLPALQFTMLSGINENII